MGEEFQWPYFFHYPPCFTLQPVKDTRDKQIQAWTELILKYCKHHKVFIFHLEDDIPLFVNSSIDRKLTYEARQLFLGALVSEGKAEWLDKEHQKCLIHWRKIQDWADIILKFVRDHGMEDGVMTIEEIRSGDETRGTGFSLSELIFIKHVCSCWYYFHAIHLATLTFVVLVAIVSLGRRHSASLLLKRVILLAVMCLLGYYYGGRNHTIPDTLPSCSLRSGMLGFLIVKSSGVNFTHKLLVFLGTFFKALEGIDRAVLIRALKLLEQRGRAAMFKGTSQDDEGVKFSAQW